MNVEDLFEQHKHLVPVTLKRYLKDPRYVAKKNNLDYDDLLQHGYVGLWNAALKFDESKGRKFQTYAIYSIKWEVSVRLRNECQWISGYTKDAQEFRTNHKQISIDSKPPTENEESYTYHELIGCNFNTENEAYPSFIEQKMEELLPPRTVEFIKLKLKGKTIYEIGKLYGISHQAVDINIKKHRKKLLNVI